MYKDTPKDRQTPRNLGIPDDSIKILNLGACLDRSCIYFDSQIPHHHALAYTKQFPTLELIAKTEKTLRGVGFQGDLEVQVMTMAEWKKRSSSGDWL